MLCDLVIARGWARLIKSDAELVYMREAGRIVTDTMNKAISRLRPGTRQFEVIADVYHTHITGFDNKFGDYTSLCPLIQVGEGTSAPHLTWTDEPLPDNGLIVVVTDSGGERLSHVARELIVID